MYAIALKTLPAAGACLLQEWLPSAFHWIEDRLESVKLLPDRKTKRFTNSQPLSIKGCDWNIESWVLMQATRALAQTGCTCSLQPCPCSRCMQPAQKLP